MIVRDVEKDETWKRKDIRGKRVDIVHGSIEKFEIFHSFHAWKLFETIEREIEDLK